MGFFSEIIDDFLADRSGNRDLWYAKKYQKEEEWYLAYVHLKAAERYWGAAECLYKDIKGKNDSLFLDEMIYLGYKAKNFNLIKKAILENIQRCLDDNLDPYNIITMRSHYDHSTSKEYKIKDILQESGILGEIIIESFHLVKKEYEKNKLMESLRFSDIPLPTEIILKYEKENRFKDAADMYYNVKLYDNFRVCLQKFYRSIRGDYYLVDDIKNLNSAGQLDKFINEMHNCDWYELTYALNELNMIKEIKNVLRLESLRVIELTNQNKDVTSNSVGNLSDTLYSHDMIKEAIVMAYEYSKRFDCYDFILEEASEKAKLIGEHNLSLKLKEKADAMKKKVF